MSTRDFSDETFDTKFKNLRSCLEEIKVDWRDAHCDLKISRNNMLEDTLKKVVMLDPYKVNSFLFNFFRSLKFLLRVKLAMMLVG